MAALGSDLTRGIADFEYRRNARDLEDLATRVVYSSLEFRNFPKSSQDEKAREVIMRKRRRASPSLESAQKVDEAKGSNDKSEKHGM